VLPPWRDQGVYPLQALVSGADGKMYRCTRAHTATPTTRPVTGADTAKYWAPFSGNQPNVIFVPAGTRR